MQHNYIQAQPICMKSWFSLNCLYPEKTACELLCITTWWQGNMETYMNGWMLRWFPSTTGGYHINRVKCSHAIRVCVCVCMWTTSNNNGSSVRYYPRSSNNTRWFFLSKSHWLQTTAWLAEKISSRFPSINFSLSHKVWTFLMLLFQLLRLL